MQPQILAVESEESRQLGDLIRVCWKSYWKAQVS
jgi:hypothetical protein